MNKLINTILKYRKLNLHEVVNYDKFNDYAITSHSTQIEGSTLTKEETTLLLDEGLTPKGKPLEHSLMVQDHHKALVRIHELSKSKLYFSTELLQEINSIVMKSTGVINRTALGDIDSSKGELRKSSVYVSNRYFPSYDKVPTLLQQMCKMLNVKLKEVSTLEEKIKLSYTAHFNFVSIHPFYDGNGRTSRLIMNLIQEHFKIPLSVVYKEDKLEYHKALEETREKDSLVPIHQFMASQHDLFLMGEIKLHKKQNKTINPGMGM